MPLSPPNGPPATAFLDTNVILRYLTQDQPGQAERARRLLEDAAAGRCRLLTCEGVVIELVQVLSSRQLYNLPRADIRMHLTRILSQRGLSLPHKQTYLRALELYATVPRLDFVDALLVAHMERTGQSTLVSFDHDFDGLPGITRYEPT